MSAGPYPTKAQFLALAGRVGTTVLNPGSGVSFSPDLNDAAVTRTLGTVVLTSGREDVLIDRIGVSLHLTPGDVQDVSTFSTPDALGSAFQYAAPVTSVTHPSIPNLPAWTVIELSGPLLLPANGALRLRLTENRSVPTWPFPAGGGNTPGATVELRDLGGEPVGGLLYVVAYPPQGEVFGRLPAGGMRRVFVPSDLLPGEFEIVEEDGQVPYLRYVARDGQAYTWTGAPVTPPETGGS